MACAICKVAASCALHVTSATATVLDSFHGPKLSKVHHAGVACLPLNVASYCNLLYAAVDMFVPRRRLCRKDPEAGDDERGGMVQAATQIEQADDDYDETNVLTAEDLALDRLKTKKRGFTVVGRRRCSR